MKLLVTAMNREHIDYLLKKDIGGIIIYIDNLSVNGKYYFDIDIINQFYFSNKEVYICLNKIMHNNDLDNLRNVLEEIKDKNVKILFYDMAVYNISKELGIVDKLVIYQDHLNASIDSNNFYYDLGIRESFITNDITYQELMEIKKNTKMKIMFLGYGYQPIFYSRRYLVSNYLKYIDSDKGKEYNIVSDTGSVYPIEEEENRGTTIYTKKPINLINYLDDLDNIDYIVLNGVNMSENELNSMLDKFIHRDKIDKPYLGFFKIKTVYKVK